MTRFVRVAAVLAVALVVTACGDDDGGLLGDTRGGSTTELPATAEDLVRELYGAIARNDAATACALFTPSGEATLLEDTGMPSCEAAIDLMAQDVDDPETYGDVSIDISEPSATELDEWCGDGGIDVQPGDGSNGPPGAFYYAEQAAGGWAITEFNSTSCP
jgi:hypothetical protein